MRIKSLSTSVLAFLFCAPPITAQNFTASKTGIFAPQNKKVLLLRDSISKKTVILFQTKLRVNTDGTPLSYHPQDPLGKDKALNNVCNAIAVRKSSSSVNLCLTHFSEAIGVFERWRDTNYQTVPRRYRITWGNVLAATEEDGKKVPCVIKSGEFTGYFGSLTSLRNGLTGNKGECGIDEQVNPMTVPALVLAGGKNIVKDFGAKVGDLLIAYNPRTRRYSSAIIGDTGPSDNLGEGSVYLNMRLRGRTFPPSARKGTSHLSIERTQVLVAIIPASRAFEETKPYTAENINQRVADWLKQSGFDTPEAFVEFVKSFEPKLR